MAASFAASFLFVASFAASRVDVPEPSGKGPESPPAGALPVEEQPIPQAKPIRTTANARSLISCTVRERA
jgi:hypothetical protein